MDITQETNTIGIDLKANEELLKVTPIEDTPFACLKNDDKYYLVLGKYRLTQDLKSEEECIEASTDASWNRIMQICAIMIAESDEVIDLKKEIEELKNKLNN